MNKNTYRFILFMLAILLILIISLGINFSSSRDTVTKLPDVLESLSPMPGAQIPKQTVLEIDLPVGYTIELFIDGYRISSNEIEFIEGTGVYRWKPGPGRSFESWRPGKHTVRINWDTTVGLPDIGEFIWVFSTY